MRKARSSTYLYLIFCIALSCANTNISAQEKDNWINYRKKMKANPQFAVKLAHFDSLIRDIYKDKGNYSHDQFKKFRLVYLKEVEQLLNSEVHDSLKLGIVNYTINSPSLVHSKKKQELFAQIDKSHFSEELIESFASNLAMPKYQTGDKLDIETIISYKEKEEVPLVLDADLNIIFFWSSWCGACSFYYKPLSEFMDKYSNSQLKIIGISLDQKEEVMLDYAKKNDLSFESYSDLNKKWRSINAERFGVIGIPVTIITDKDRNVLYVNPSSKMMQFLVDNYLE